MFVRGKEGLLQSGAGVSLPLQQQAKMNQSFESLIEGSLKTVGGDWVVSKPRASNLVPHSASIL